MDILMDMVKVLGRLVTILPFLLFIGLFMGKRSIGELPVFDFLIVLVLGSVVGADIADPSISHIHTVVAMIAIALLQKLIIFIKMKNRKIGRLLSFEPTIVIYQGQWLEKNMKKVQYTIENILQMLREKDIFVIEDVEMATVEADGALSVKLVSDKETITRGDLRLGELAGDYEIPVILDGELQFDLLERISKDEAWIKQKLMKDHVIDVQDVFYGAITKTGNFRYTLKGHNPRNIPPIDH